MNEIYVYKSIRQNHKMTLFSLFLGLGVIVLFAILYHFQMLERNQGGLLLLAFVPVALLVRLSRKEQQLQRIKRRIEKMLS